MSENDLQALLQTGIEAVQSGRPAVARALFDRIIARDPDHEAAWLWKATVAETPEERRACLRRVLVINPENTQAGQALEQIQRETRPAPRRSAPIPAARDERAALLQSAAPARRRPLLPLALIVIALALMASGAALIIRSQNGTAPAPTITPDEQQRQMRTATLDALRAPALTATETPPGGLRSLPSRRDHLPPTWTPTATWTLTPALTPAGAN